MKDSSGSSIADQELRCRAAHGGGGGARVPVDPAEPLLELVRRPGQAQVENSVGQLQVKAVLGGVICHQHLARTAWLWPR